MEKPKDEVTTVVIELEPGQIFVKIAAGRLHPDRIEFFLKATIDDWFSAHPGLVVDRMESVVTSGLLSGIHLWYHRQNNDPEDIAAEYEAKSSPVTIEVHRTIAADFSREYIEAVIDQVLQILAKYPHRADTLVVINPRRVAVVFEFSDRRGVVLPLSQIDNSLDEMMKSDLVAWLARPKTNFYVFHVPSGWLKR